MKKGMLNKPELNKLAKSYRELTAMIQALPVENLCPTEKATLEALAKSRNAMGEILRWQDFNGAWKSANA